MDSAETIKRTIEAAELSETQQENLEKQNKFIVFLDQYIPEQLKKEDIDEDHVRARVILAVLGFCVFFLVTAITGLLIISLLQINVIWDGAIASVAALFFVLASIWDFRRNAVLARTTSLFGFMAYTLVTLAIYVTGGWESPVMYFYLSVPIMIFLVAGRIVGIIWTMVILITYAAFFYLHIVFYSFCLYSVLGGIEIFCYAR